MTQFAVRDYRLRSVGQCIRIYTMMRWYEKVRVEPVPILAEPSKYREVRDAQQRRREAAYRDAVSRAEDGVFRAMEM